MEQLELDVTSREILGKKVRFLRRQGITPLHLFGHGIESAALQCATTNLRQVLAEAGQTRLISLRVDDGKIAKNVVVRGVQREPISGETLHVDFYEVQMAELLKMEIPIVLIGKAPALRSKGTTLVQELNTLAIECLPSNIPNSVEVDISVLAEPDQVVRVKDIEPGEGITILNDPELVVSRISLRPVEKEEVVA
ncbi:MAG: 50S ribosomal protein L25, partial [Dehalococcoidales bacterium]|nr:50S ribosomal protein L25 [Dehalococcoidales bacterium]